MLVRSSLTDFDPDKWQYIIEENESSSRLVFLGGCFVRLFWLWLNGYIKSHVALSSMYRPSELCLDFAPDRWMPVHVYAQLNKCPHLRIPTRCVDGSVRSIKELTLSLTQSFTRKNSQNTRQWINNVLLRKVNSFLWRVVPWPIQNSWFWTDEMLTGRAMVRHPSFVYYGFQFVSVIVFTVIISGLIHDMTTRPKIRPKHEPMSDKHCEKAFSCLQSVLLRKIYSFLWQAFYIYIK